MKNSIRDELISLIWVSANQWLVVLQLIEQLVYLNRFLQSKRGYEFELHQDLILYHSDLYCSPLS